MSIPGSRFLPLAAALCVAAAACAQGPIDSRHDLGLFGDVLADTVTVPDGVIPVDAPHLRLVWDEDAVPRDLFGQTSSVVAFDWDGDGDQDLFIGQSVNVPYPSRFLVNDGTGRFSSVEVAGLPAFVLDAATADLDGDGRGDLIVSSQSASGLEGGLPEAVSSQRPSISMTQRFRQDLVVLLARPPGGFLAMPVLPPPPDHPDAAFWPRSDADSTGTGYAWQQLMPADLDRDGRVDLAAGVGWFGRGYGATWVLRNTGAALVAGYARLSLPVDQRTTGRAVQQAITDIDGDGWTDLTLNAGAGYFAASSPILVLRNRGGTLAEVPDTLDTGYQAKDTIQWLDLDADGDSDLLAVQTDAQGSHNDLYLNDGRGCWRPRGAAAGLWAGYSYQTTVAGDLDQDGLPDLVALRLGNTNSARPAAVLRNLGGGRFGTVQGALEPAWVAPLGPGVLVDVDGDLDMDLVAGGQWGYVDAGDEESSRVRLYRNESRGGRSLVLRLQGTRSNRQALGAVVRVRTGGMVQRREPGEGALASLTPPLDIHVGLGGSAACDSVTVRWPSGLAECWTGLEAGRLHVLVEGRGAVVE